MLEKFDRNDEKFTPVAPQPDVARAGRWPLQNAKVRFGTLVRRLHGEGPRHGTGHGRDAVVAMSGDEFRKLTG